MAVSTKRSRALGSPRRGAPRRAVLLIAASYHVSRTIDKGTDLYL
jgi:hypothetical protein